MCKDFRYTCVLCCICNCFICKKESRRRVYSILPFCRPSIHGIMCDNARSALVDGGGWWWVMGGGVGRGGGDRVAGAGG